MRRRTRIASVLLIALTAAALTGCAQTKQAVKQTIEQGIEPTTTGPHNTAPANAAENAVDKANAAQQQLDQGIDAPQE